MVNRMTKHTIHIPAFGAARAAAGLEDTLFRSNRKPEVIHGSESGVEQGIQV